MQEGTSTRAKRKDVKPWHPAQDQCTAGVATATMVLLGCNAAGAGALAFMNALLRRKSKKQNPGRGVVPFYCALPAAERWLQGRE